MKKRGLPRPRPPGQMVSTWGSICDIRADVGDEKLMTYGRGIRNLCSFLDMTNGSLISERVAAVPALQHFSENSHVTSQMIPS